MSNLINVWALTILYRDKPDRYVVRYCWDDGEAWFPVKTCRAQEMAVKKWSRI